MSSGGSSGSNTPQLDPAITGALAQELQANQGQANPTAQQNQQLAQANSQVLGGQSPASAQATAPNSALAGIAQQGQQYGNQAMQADQPKGGSSGGGSSLLSMFGL